MSCIKKWFQQRRNSGKCPQCNRKCSLKDVRKLYASRLVVINEESHKRIRSLEDKCAALESKGADWRKKEAEWQKSEVHLRVQKLTESFGAAATRYAEKAIRNDKWKWELSMEIQICAPVNRTMTTVATTFSSLSRILSFRTKCKSQLHIFLNVNASHTLMINLRTSGVVMWL